MNHQRKTIRDALVAKLADKTAAGPRVFSTREVPWKKTELPGIAVYAMEEESDAGKRSVRVAVLLVESLTEKVDDSLDALAMQVETALRADPSLGGAAVGLRYTGMQVEIAEDQGRPIGAMRMTYDALYFG